MTAAVPDPRFRDQLKKALTTAESNGTLIWGTVEVVDLLMPTIAAELARVEAAANQRAAEVGEVVLRLGDALAAINPDALTYDAARLNRIALDAHTDLARALWGPPAAALASPAPAPHAEDPR